MGQSESDLRETTEGHRAKAENYSVQDGQFFGISGFHCSPRVCCAAWRHGTAAGMLRSVPSPTTVVGRAIPVKKMPNGYIKHFTGFEEVVRHYGQDDLGCQVRCAAKIAESRPPSTHLGSPSRLVPCRILLAGLHSCGQFPIFCPLYGYCKIFCRLAAQT